MRQLGWSQLEPVAADVVTKIMPNSDEVNKLMLRLLPSYPQFIEHMIKNVTPELAATLISNNAAEFLLGYFIKHKKTFYINLLLQLIKYESINTLVNVKTIFKLSEVSPQLKEITFQKLEQISRINLAQHKKIEVEFETIIPQLFECLDSRDCSEKSKLAILMTLANLSLRDTLRPSIIANSGIQIFTSIVKKQHDGFTKVEAQRVAAKGLVNLVSAKRDLRLNAITELSE